MSEYACKRCYAEYGWLAWIKQRKRCRNCLWNTLLKPGMKVKWNQMVSNHQQSSRMCLRVHMHSSKRTEGTQTAEKSEENHLSVRLISFHLLRSVKIRHWSDGGRPGAPMRPDLESRGRREVTSGPPASCSGVAAYTDLASLPTPAPLCLHSDVNLWDREKTMMVLKDGDDGDKFISQPNPFTSIICLCNRVKHQLQNIRSATR